MEDLKNKYTYKKTKTKQNITVTIKINNEVKFYNRHEHRAQKGNLDILNSQMQINK